MRGTSAEEFGPSSEILFLNWRDGVHPQAGGAEVYCWEMARRVAARGHRVTLFTAQHPNTPARSFKDGVEIVRKGGTFSVYGHAAAFVRANRQRFAAIVDCQNGIPFFAPIFADPAQAIVGVIHHVHQEQFAIRFKGPMRYVGQALEGPVSRWAYRSCPTATVSPSTRREVRRNLGFRDAIYVIPNGGPGRAERTARSAEPTITVVSRLVAQKQIELLLAAIPGIQSSWPGLRVHIVGDGPHREALEQLNESSVVTFHGYLPHAEKQALLSAAWLTVATSRGEGWGLNVIEANAVGVPTVAFDVAGLRDSVVDGVTGWLVAPDASLGEKIQVALSALQEELEAQQWAGRCQAWSERFSWEQSADRFYNLISSEVARRHAGRVGSVAERRRKSTDLACVATVDAPLHSASDAPLMPVQHERLRRTDQVVAHEDGSKVLLFGADERDSVAALQRVGLTSPTELTIARTAHLLVGPHAEPTPGIAS